jgi:hypothetical protein
MAKHKGNKGSQNARQQPAPEDDGGIYVSGKLVISAVVVIALLAAGFSWWFRYTSTRRAAQFWGPQNVLLIRDAPHVQLLNVGPMAESDSHAHDPNTVFADHYHTLGGVVRVASRRDASQLHGLIHLRHELLMDRSVQADNAALPAAESWRYGLEFRSTPEGPPLVVLFSEDCRRMLRHPPSVGTGLANATANFAEGLKTVFAEWEKQSR